MFKIKMWLKQDIISFSMTSLKFLTIHFIVLLFRLSKTTNI